MSRSSSILLHAATVSAGFPSPAKDYVEKVLDLNEHLIFNKNATYLMRVAGDSMKEAGIFNGDEVIVDRSLPAIDGNVVVAVVGNGFVIKRLRVSDGKQQLVSDNPNYEDLVFLEDTPFVIWGVVTRVLHKV